VWRGHRSSAKGARISALKAPMGWDVRLGSEEGAVPSPKDNFYIKMVSFYAFRVSITYRFLPFLPESEICVELKFIGDRSSILGIIIYLLLP